MKALNRATMSGEGTAGAARAERETGTEGLAGVLPFLFAVRWGAWAIAIVAVNFGNLAKENSGHEPVLLALSFVEILAATLYVPLLRPRVRRGMGAGWGPRDDLIVLGLLDISFVLAVIYFSGGWGSPYYQYALTSLLVPAFLLGWRRSVFLLLAFTAAYFAILSTAGKGTDGAWMDDRIAAIIITPILVVVVVQYLAQLTRRLEEQRGEARRALAENVRLQKEREELAAQEERSRIAREIHDGIAQSIYMLSLNLEKAAETTRGDENLGPHLGRLVGLAKEALLEVRHYIFDLKPLLSGDAGLTSTIQAQVQEFTAVSGLPVELKIEGEERKVPLAVGSSLYRIAQEALANIYRHAGATQIEARLAFGADSVSLEIRDNGRGFAIDPSEGADSSGRGLRNIQQRAAELGGEVEITSAPEKGTTVRVRLPAG
jgi:signal transduction histidine kinase